MDAETKWKWREVVGDLKIKFNSMKQSNFDSKMMMLLI